ncbi:MAG TPA: STAS domain-containing protein [Acidimicrobiales bacterium]|nr:STAS domain-containing protein [Acidimicrobiales bacterium]
MSDPVSVEIMDRSPTSAVARLAGDFDIVTSEGIKRELAELVDAGHASLVLDLAGVGFVDSSGLGALVALHRYAESQGGRFAVRGVPPPVQRLFAITGLDGLLAVDG